MLGGCTIRGHGDTIGTLLVVDNRDDDYVEGNNNDYYHYSYTKSLLYHLGGRRK